VNRSRVGLVRIEDLYAPRKTDREIHHRDKTHIGKQSSLPVVVITALRQYHEPRSHCFSNRCGKLSLSSMTSPRRGGKTPDFFPPYPHAKKFDPRLAIIITEDLPATVLPLHTLGSHSGG